ncbi:hypothetical protein [Desulfoluna sp.]|uniref:hypothetical protein n=1 Tax=Desulfoluna sp. TaxID=2045199 RepID=UPI002610F156|nr:hypothetical protein [Desulfoluna sp.]
MFLNSDNLRKKKVTYQAGKDFFRDKNGMIPFDEIDAFFVSSVNHYTNSVYEGHEYTLTLGLKGTGSYYVLEASTPRKASYEVLCTLHDALKAHMSRRLQGAREAGVAVVFPTYQKKYHIVLENNRLRVSYLTGNGCSFEVQKIIQSHDGLWLDLVGDGRKVTVFHESLSNSHVFTTMAREMMPFELKPKSAVSLWVHRFGVALVLLGSLNKWLRLYEGGLFEACVSTFSAIILGVWLMTAPFFWLVGRLNEKKMRKDQVKRV